MQYIFPHFLSHNLLIVPNQPDSLTRRNSMEFTKHNLNLNFNIFFYYYYYYTFFLLFLLTPTQSKQQQCPNKHDHDLLLNAFSSVSGFSPSFICWDHSIRLGTINLSHRNLSGSISWHHLQNLTHLESLDLSHNHLMGFVPSWVWSLNSLININLSFNNFGGSLYIQYHNNPNKSNVPSFSSLKSLNLSHNRFTKLLKIKGFNNLKQLDLSNNNLRSFLPFGFANLSGLVYLDVSNNNLSGNFPLDFPPLNNLNFLNISFNNFSGSNNNINGISKYSQRFGKYAFIKAGNFTNINVVNLPHHSNNITKTLPHHKPLIKHLPIKKPPQGVKPIEEKKEVKFKVILTATFGSFGILVVCLVCVFLVHGRRKRRMRSRKWSISKPIQWNQVALKMEKSGPYEFETESGTSWMADIREATSAGVVMFEKPLMSLTFKDLMVATCQFGRESQLATRGSCCSGPLLYRAVLPGEIHVAIKVLECLRGVDNEEAVAMFQDLSKLKHPNLLPIFGYCIAGKEKLLLYEFMSNGDLHSWLHELPPGKPDVDDWSTDTWQYHQEPDSSICINSPIKLNNWLTRHRIAVGVARGLAYLHHARSKPVVHGHLVPSNILLADDLEPRIADFGMFLGGRDLGSVEDDVFGFGLVLIELFTGLSVDSDESGLSRVRKMVRDGYGFRVIDVRLKLDNDSLVKSSECLRVGYLCTTEIPSKRPTMHQVVGLLKDIHPS